MYEPLTYINWLRIRLKSSALDGSMRSMTESILVS